MQISRRTLLHSGAVAAAAGVGLTAMAYPNRANAATTGGVDIAPQVVYSPAAGSSFNPEGGRAAGTTYAKIITLKNSGSSNGASLVTFDQLVLEGGKQIYPIYRRSSGSSQWQRVSTITPSQQFPQLTRTAQPFLFEVPPNTTGLDAGTILFAGMIMPEDRSSSRLVLYKSTDHGKSWSYLSTIDQGGPATYDPSPTSTTSTVWEPSLAVDAYGGLVAYYSDERQKDRGVLQAVVYRRSLDGGRTWGSVTNVSAPTNRSDRPGMITVTRMGDGRYMATFEVVNRPSQTRNNAPVYFKISKDGLDWSPEESIGSPILLSDGRGIGSSPFVRWVPEGGPHGMVVVASKWALDSSGNLNGGQNYYVNRSNGVGSWERLPYAVTYDATDTAGGTFSGFAQCFDYDPVRRCLDQATNRENLTTTYNDIVVGATPLNAAYYVAQRATVSNTRLVTHGDALGGQKIGDINSSASTVVFDVVVTNAGTYQVDVRYDAGMAGTAVHTLKVNGAAANDVALPSTGDWGRFAWASVSVNLKAGHNTIEMSQKSSYAELDAIRVRRAFEDAPLYVEIINQESGKLLEIPNALLADGALAAQWGPTAHRTQTWELRAQTSAGTWCMINAHSSKFLEIPAEQTQAGIQAAQWGPTGSTTQTWKLASTPTGITITNAHSNLVLEVKDASHADGAAVQQWSSNGYPCQRWVILAEAAM